MVPTSPRLDALESIPAPARARVARDPVLRTLFAVLGERGADRFPDEREAALLAHCSLATLKRRLREGLGLSFRRLREALMKRAAARTLSDPEVAVKAAARVLGYRSARAFDRAFGRWYGVTPGRWREREAVEPLGEPASRAVRSID